MKNFVLQQLLPLTTSVIITWTLAIYLANGKSDPFYLRFTGEPQTNLILGTSRAAQGVLPDALKSTLDKDFYNFSFTVAHSPFGPVYNRAIKSKLDTTQNNQIFIICVDPWSISSKCSDPNNCSLFRENDLCLGKIMSVNSTPNLSYLRSQLKPYQIFKPYVFNSNLILNHDGWLEVNIDMGENEKKIRLNNKIRSYENTFLPVYRYSELRVIYLLNLVKWLKNFGEVYLVRLPIHQDLYKIEVEFMTEFQNNIEMVILASNGYFDMTEIENNFIYTDGNHLYKASGYEVSKMIGEWIRKKQSISAEQKKSY